MWRDERTIDSTGGASVFIFYVRFTSDLSTLSAILGLGQ